MADFIDCSRKLSAFPIQVLLASLFAEEGTTGQYVLRIVEKSADRTADPISCDNKEDFEILFQQAMDLASDNKPALRVVITDRVEGATLVDVPDCTNAEGLNLLARKTFITTTDGEIAVNLANIT